MKIIVRRTDNRDRMLKQKRFCESAILSILHDDIYSRSRSAGFAGAFVDRMAETKGVCYFRLFWLFISSVLPQLDFYDKEKVQHDGECLRVIEILSELWPRLAHKHAEEYIQADY